MLKITLTTSSKYEQMILSDSELSISYLNMKGLHDSIVGCKLNDTFIRDNIFIHDITVLS